MPIVFFVISTFRDFVMKDLFCSLAYGIKTDDSNIRTEIEIINICQCHAGKFLLAVEGR